MTRTAYEVQHDFAISSGLRSEIIWDSLSPDQSDILKQKIDTLLLTSTKNKGVIEKERKNLFRNVWLQRKYTNRTLLSAIIYVLVVEETNIDLAKQATAFVCHPVFRTRKCLNDYNSKGCCMTFIDEHGRIYKNWSQYVKNNVLPKGTFIAPANGIYTFDDSNDEVELEYHLTPAARTKSKLFKTTDNLVGVGGFIATVPIAAALACPVAGPVLAAATAVTITTAAYSSLRSVIQLNDRRKHGQSTALTDRVARNNWIGVAGGVVGLGAAGATKVLSCAATAGQEISMGAKLVVNGINVSSIVLSGSGIVNGVYDLYTKINDDDEICAIDMLQLASSLLVFTHSINNLKLASNIAIRRSGSSVLNELRSQMRKGFNQISQEAHGSTSINKFDIIRTLNDVPFREVLMSLHKINSHLIGNGAINKIVTSVLPQNIVNACTGGIEELNFLHLAEAYGGKFALHVINPSSLLDVLTAMAKYLCEEVFILLMKLAKMFIDQNVDAIDGVLNTFVSTETVLYKILMQCVANYTDFSYAYLASKQTEILKHIEEYFNTLNPVNDENQKRVCKVCNGYFYICSL